MSIKAQFAASSFWVVAGTAATNLSGFLIFAVLARLLQPVDIGIVALAVIYIEFTGILAAGGLAEALIRRAHWDDRAGSTAFWASLAIGGLFALATALGASAGAALLLPGLGSVLGALAVSFLIEAARIVPEAKLRREFRYRALAVRSFAGSAVGGAIGIALALKGCGIWSLVAQRLVASTVQTGLTWLAAAWRPSLHCSRAELRPFMSIGVPLVLAQLASYANARVSEVALGVVGGAEAVAYFRAGRRGLDLLVQSTIQPMQSAALSAMARLDGADAVAGAYGRLTGVCALVSAPVFLGAAAIAPDFVRLFFGPQWAPSGLVMALLALVVGAATLRYFIGPALVAVDRAPEVLRANLVMVAANGAAAFATAPLGVAAVAAGQTAAGYLSLPMALAMLRRGVPVEAMAVVRGIAAPMAAATAMALILVAVRALWLADASSLARVAVLVPLGAVVYAALLATLGRHYLRRALGELLPLLPVDLRHRGSRT